MNSPALSVPTKRTSGWVAETDPKYARAWLDSLPLADSGEAARELYQALYTVNRLALPTPRRLELLELYESPIATVAISLQSHLLRATQPLSVKKRQLAEFVRRLYIEMANGYKCCLQEWAAARLLWGREERLARACEGALRHLRDVLIRSYEVYIPYPAGVWKEIHEIFRFAEERDLLHTEIERAGADGSSTTSIGARYTQIMLLGLAQPYQLPQGACHQVVRFLDVRGTQTQIADRLPSRNPVGHFLIDLTLDTPPSPFPRDGATLPNPNLRVLSAIALVSTVQNLVARLQKGESVAALGLGIDCLEETCIDLLQRMVSVWGLTPRRRFHRIKQNAHVSLCSGLAAVHFFANGQASLAIESDAPSAMPVDVSPDESDTTETFVDLDRIDEHAEISIAHTTPSAKKQNIGSFRVERCEVRDTGPQGMSLVRRGNGGSTLRVGDLVGIQQPGDAHWNVAVVRWLKSPESEMLEFGVEVLAPDITPVAVRGSVDGGDYEPAVLLPPSMTPRRPASLLIPRGFYADGHDLYLLERNRALRLVRPLKCVERTSAYERVVFAEVATAYG